MESDAMDLDDPPGAAPEPPADLATAICLAHMRSILRSEARIEARELIAEPLRQVAARTQAAMDTWSVDKQHASIFYNLHRDHVSQAQAGVVIRPYAPNGKVTVVLSDELAEFVLPDPAYRQFDYAYPSTPMVKELVASFAILTKRFEASSPPPRLVALYIWLMAHTAYAWLTRRQHPSLADAYAKGETLEHIYPPVHSLGHIYLGDAYQVRTRYPFLRYAVDQAQKTTNPRQILLLASLSLFTLFPCPAEDLLPPVAQWHFASSRAGFVECFHLQLAPGAPLPPQFDAQHSAWRVPRGTGRICMAFTGDGEEEDDDDDAELVDDATPQLVRLSSLSLEQRAAEGLPLPPDLSLDWENKWLGGHSLAATILDMYAAFKRDCASIFNPMVKHYEHAVEQGDPVMDRDLTLLLGEWPMPGGW